MADVTISNTGTQLLSTSPSSFVATDEQGFFIEQPFLTSTDESLVNFDYIDLASGEQQQGVIYFQLFGDIPLAQITYGDGYERDIVVADIGPDAPPAPPVTIQPPLSRLPWPAAPIAKASWNGGPTWWIASVAATITGAFEDVQPEDLDPGPSRRQPTSLRPSLRSSETATRLSPPRPSTPSWLRSTSRR